MSTITDRGPRARANPDEKEEFIALDDDDASGTRSFKGYMRIAAHDRGVRLRVGTTDGAATGVEVGLFGQPPLLTINSQSGPGLFSLDQVVTAQVFQVLQTNQVFMRVLSPSGNLESPLFTGLDPLPIGDGNGPQTRAGLEDGYIYASNVAAQVGLDVDVRALGLPRNAPVALMFGRRIAEPFRFGLGGLDYYWFNDAAVFVGASSDAIGNVEMSFDLPFSEVSDIVVVQAAAAAGGSLFTTPGLKLFVF